MSQTLLVQYPPATIGSLLVEAARRAPDAVALVAPTRRALTYRQLEKQLVGVANYLARAGHARGSRIALALPNGPELAVALLAVSSCSTCAPLNPELDEATVMTLLAAMRINALMVPSGRESTAKRAARSLGIPLIEVDFESGNTAGCLSFDDAMAPEAPPADAPEPPRPDDVALLMHTSGTTGKPKVVPLTHRRLTESARARIDLYGLGSRDRCLLGMPLFTAAGVRRGLLLPLIAGGSLVCPEDFEAAHFVSLIEQFAPTYYTAPAALQIAVLEELSSRAQPLTHCLRFAETSGAPILAVTRQRLAERLQVPVIIGYGITETGSIAQTPLPPASVPEGSVGVPTRMEIRIRDETGEEVGPGRTGEILVRGPEVFDGYEDDPQANAAAFDDGWFRTGDLGWLDDDGFLFICGRVKDIINRGGVKIAPSEVEAALATHPAVLEVAAFAVPHATLGEDLVATVVLRGESSEEQLREHAAGRLAAFKVPTRILVLSGIPRAALGKPKRGELAQLAIDSMRRDFVEPSTPTERRLAAMLVEVLQTEKIGANDNFFELGGDSLRGARLLGRVQTEFGVALQMDVLFRLATVAALARHVDSEISPLRPAVAAATPMSIERQPRRAREGKV